MTSTGNGGVRRVRVLVTGHVQGVGFRYSAEVVASRLGVHGWVRNRGDRAVEAEVEGTEQAVEQMLEWMARGPASARVLKLVTTQLAPTGETGFGVRPSE